MSIKKPLLQKLPLEKDSSFVFHKFVSPFFETPWHYHEEIEIVLCEAGFGQKIIGNHSSPYKAGDLMLLGSNLPHWFKADNSFYDEEIEEREKPATIVIQFKWDCFGSHFFDIQEMYYIKQILLGCEKGLEFHGETRDKINNLLREHVNSPATTRFYVLLEMLEIMSHSKEFTTISDIGMVGISKKDSDRMGQIMSTVHFNFHTQINLDKLASSVGFTKAAFCRYFKARTQKTFINYLNEVRINHVCELLRNTDKPITEIAFDSGFTNISNFNRQFKELMNCSPKDFRNSLDSI